MSTEQTRASASNKNSTKLARLADYAKIGMRSGLYGMLFAGALGATVTAVMNKLESEESHRTMVQLIVGEACMPNGAYRGYYIGLGDDIDLAAGMLRKYPEQFQEICKAIKASQATSKEFEFNNQVHVLAGALGVSEQFSKAVVEQEKFKLTAEVRKAESQKTDNNINFSGPNR